MSSVSSTSDRTSQDDAIRRVRDTYSQKEAEEAKLHAKRIREIDEAHQAEVEKLGRDHESQLNELKDKSNETITSRDMKYQKEIDELRDLHQKQLTRARAEIEATKESVVGAGKDAVERLQAKSDKDKALLSKNFEEQLLKSEHSRQADLDRVREVQQEQGPIIRAQMNEAHRKEIQSLVKDRDLRFAALHDEEDTTKKVKDQQLNSLKTEKENEINRRSSSYDRSLKATAVNSATAQDRMREEMADEVKRENQVYSRATEAYRGEMEKARAHLEETVVDRVEPRTRDLEFRNRELLDEQPRQAARLSRKYELQLKNQREALGDNLKVAEEQRAQVASAANERLHSDIKKINDENSKNTLMMQKNLQGKLSDDRLAAEGRLQTLQTESDRELTHVKTVDDKRVGSVRANSEIEQTRQKAYFDRAAAAMKENFDTTLREMRDRFRKEQETAFANFNRQMQEGDAKFQEKLAANSVKYEKQIATLQDVHEKELMEAQAQLDRTRKEYDKKIQVELNSQAQQYVRRIANLQETNKREVETLNRRHEETLASLTKTRQS